MNNSFIDGDDDDDGYGDELSMFVSAGQFVVFFVARQSDLLVFGWFKTKKT